MQSQAKQTAMSYLPADHVWRCPVLHNIIDLLCLRCKIMLSMYIVYAQHNGVDHRSAGNHGDLKNPSTFAVTPLDF
jgi:hypothetical protein